MQRRTRTSTGGYIYHVRIRGVDRATLFHKTGDFAVLERVLCQAKDIGPMPLLSYCLLSNNFHLVLWRTTIATTAASSTG